MNSVICKISIRGGSWGYDLPSLRSADRSDDPPDALFDGIGLRIARDLAPEPNMPDWNLRVFEDAAHGVSVLYPASFSTVVDAAQAELRTLVLSVPRAAGDRITLYLTGTRRHDWDDLRVLAHTLSVAR